jgi:hypothetical protein
MEKVKSLLAAVRGFLDGMLRASGLNEEAWKRQISQREENPPAQGSPEYWRQRQV